MVNCIRCTPQNDMDALGIRTPAARRQSNQTSADSIGIPDKCDVVNKHSANVSNRHKMFVTLTFRIAGCKHQTCQKDRFTWRSGGLSPRDEESLISLKLSWRLKLECRGRRWQISRAAGRMCCCTTFTASHQRLSFRRSPTCCRLRRIQRPRRILRWSFQMKPLPRGGKPNSPI